MGLNSFGREILASAQKTVNLELEEPKSELKKTLTLLIDALVLRLINLTFAIFGVFFLLFAIVYALQAWFEVPLWASSGSISGLSLVCYMYIKYWKEKI